MAAARSLASSRVKFPGEGAPERVTAWQRDCRVTAHVSQSPLGGLAPRATVRRPPTPLDSPSHSSALTTSSTRSPPCSRSTAPPPSHKGAAREKTSNKIDTILVSVTAAAVRAMMMAGSSLRIACRELARSLALQQQTVGAQRCGSAKRRAALTFLADSDPGYREARARAGRASCYASGYSFV
jgi:hypothetical protein